MRLKFGFMHAIVIACLSCGAAQGQSEKDWSADTVVVAQGEAKVTVGDVDAWMQEVTEDKRLGFIQSPERIEAMLTQLLMMKQLNVEAKASGVDQKPLVVSHARMAAERVVARYQLDAYAASVKAPDFTVLAQERYQGEKEKYRGPDVADFAHILISPEKRGEDAAQALIEKLHRQLLRKPGNFAKLAAQYSSDSGSAARGGVIEGAKLNVLAEEFAETLRTLKVGELSRPVKTQFGWHVIRLDKYSRGSLPSYEELKPTIIATLESEYRQNTIRAYSDEVRQREMQPNVPVLERLAYRYGFTGAADEATPTKAEAGETTAPAPGTNTP
jgi:peptidyl-prolyl cis-trans isomerase C